MCNLRHKTENKGSCEEYCYKAVKSGKHIELYIYKDKNFKRKTKETNDLMKIINDWDITENEKKDTFMVSFNVSGEAVIKVNGEAVASAEAENRKSQGPL